MSGIDFKHIEYLTKNSFLRNVFCSEFIQENNFRVNLSQYFCYCVGIIQGERIVNVVKILHQHRSPGVTSFLIQWYNVSCFKLDELAKMNLIEDLESVTFWVHSGVALRKNFFIYDDRMSLLKSTFIFDEKRNQYYRLHHLQPYTFNEQLHPLNSPIYSSVNKTTFAARRTNIREKYDENKSNEDLPIKALKKTLRGVLKEHNSFSYIETKYPRLFKEISIVINNEI